MNLPLYKLMIKTNLKYFFGFGIGSAIYVTLMTLFFPMLEDNIDKIDELIKIFPEDLLRGLGFESISTYGQYISAEYYGLFYLLILGAFTVMISIHLLARLVDRGSMAYLLSTHVSRIQIAFTQICILISGLIIIHLLTFLAGFLAATFIIDTENVIAFGEFFLINFVGFLLFFAIGGYSLLISALFNDEKNALALAGGITFIFYALDMIGKIIIKIDWIRHFSLFSLYEPGKIASGDANISLSITIFIAIGLVGYLLTLLIFDKRNLPL